MTAHPSPTGSARPGAFPALVAAGAELGLLPEDLYLAWSLAELWTEAAPEAREALGLLVTASWVRSRQGGTRLSLEHGLDDLLEALGAAPEARTRASALAATLVSGALPPGLEALVGGPGDPVPLLQVAGRLYHQRAFVLESQVVDGLAGRLAPPPELGTAAAREAAVADVLARPQVGSRGPVRLDPSQARAVRQALTGRLTVITGGPGTGKTSIVVSVLRALARLGVPSEAVALAAPTGKAADRLRQSIEGALAVLGDPADPDLHLRQRPPRPATLHRLLGAGPDGGHFRHHEGHPVPYQVVLVDEASMVDLHLADRLLRALPPETRLVLLGDAEQLPSVEPGAVFADLCRALGSHPSLVRLTHCHRSDRAILDVAEAVRDGRLAALAPPVLPVFAAPERLAHGAAGAGGTRGGRQGALPGMGDASPAPARDPEGLPGASLVLARQADALGQVLDWWWEVRVRAPLLELGGPGATLKRVWSLPDASGRGDQDLGALLAHLEGRRLLCFTRVDPVWGTEALNNLLRQRLRGLLGSGGGGEGGFLPGEPVMVTRNDYARGLFNGDTGVVLRVRDDATRRVTSSAVFPRRDGLVAWPVQGLTGLLEPAWAITVHKSQGSEYDHVAILLPEGEGRGAGRELVYTALTRARHTALLVGTVERLQAAARRPVVRDTGVAERLGAALEGRA